MQIAGNVICRQRPGTAKGFVFISLEDETGVSNAIVTPDLFEKLRLVDHGRAVSVDRRRSAEFRRRGADQSADRSRAARSSESDSVRTAAMLRTIFQLKPLYSSRRMTAHGSPSTQR